MSTKVLLFLIVFVLTQESNEKSIANEFIEKYLYGKLPHNRYVNNGSVFRDQTSPQPLSPNVFSRAKRQQLSTEDPIINGIKVEGSAADVWTGTDKHTYISADTDLELRLFGYYLNSIEIGFTTKYGDIGSICHPIITDIIVEGIDNETGITMINLPEGKYYLCTAHYEANESDFKETQFYKHISPEFWMTITSEGPFIPIWVQIILIVVLLMMCGLFSGLNLGLMALDRNELQVIVNCGTEQEKRFAKAITPVRKRGNYLLCTLLLGNVLVNSTLTILIEDLSTGLIAVITSTLSIVVIGEIIPQSLCSRHGLAVGAHTLWLTYIFMVLTFPLSFPISLILDKILGEEIGNVYDRERLMEYIRVTKDYNRLEADEVNMISGALKLRKIKVTDIMTTIDDVFMLPFNAIMNFETLTDITSSGYSRIPIYENERSNVVAILHAKDLAFIDPDDNMHLRALIEFYKRPLYFVYEDVSLDVMLDEFKQGKSHMAFVRRITDDGINDPVCELTGVVTLEDVIEELIQAEINDETDVISDNRRKHKRKEVSARPNFSDFVRLSGEDESHKLITSQLALAAFRYLSTFVDPFKPQYISDNVLKRLMAKQIYLDIKVPLDSNQLQTENLSTISKDRILYTYGIPADYFILILEGKAKVIIGKENLQYEAGPFAYFGVSALKMTQLDKKNVAKTKSIGRLSITDLIPSPHSASSPGLPLVPKEIFIPDYTVICLENTTILKVTRDVYFKAYCATVVEKQRDSDQSEDDGLNSEPKSQKLMSGNSSTNLKPGIGRRRTYHYSDSSSSKLKPSDENDKTSVESSSRTSVTTPNAPLPVQDDMNSAIVKQNTDDINSKNNSNESITKRDSDPVDKKFQVI